MGTEVTLSLISHTNVGKTTLARTLLRRDVGEVEDRAHVTEVSEAHVLLETEQARLVLWDTPGFGDTARLMRRLRRERSPVAWFLGQLWDRIVDRPLWCSQEAARNVRSQADAVLYLVNAAEDPEHAGYVGMELELLTWIDRPVMLLLNQLAGPAPETERRWRDHVRRWPVVRDVTSLDAFTRCWTEEGALLRRVVGLLDGTKHDAMQELSASWDRRNLAVFEASVAEMAVYLADTAVDREGLDESTRDDSESGGAWQFLTKALKTASGPKRRSMKALNGRLDARTAGLMRGLIDAYGLSGESSLTIERRLQDLQVKGRSLDERGSALAGAVVTGALGGLAADALAGGLTLGGGIIAGGILGALGGSVLARGYRWVGGGVDPHVRWTPEFLVRLTEQLLLRYLAVAHHGRGRGVYRDLEQPTHWSESVTLQIESERSSLEAVWKRAERDGTAAVDRIRADLGRTIDRALRSILVEAYPRSASLLRLPS